MKVRFLAKGRRATPHPDEPQFSHAAGEVVDLASITRSPRELAAELLALGRAEAAEEAAQDHGGSSEVNPGLETHVGDQAEPSEEPVGHPVEPEPRKRRRRESVLD